jgi:hypothetical protein
MMDETEIFSLPPTAHKALLALATYRFLTVHQMLRLGVAKDEGNLRKNLNRMLSAKRDGSGLSRPKEIGVLDFGVLVGKGRLSRLYFLTPRGAEALKRADRHAPDAAPVKHAVRFQNDYFHRVNTVDFQITLSQFAETHGHEITMSRQYFSWTQKVGRSPARPETSIDLLPGYIDPDSTYMLTGPDGTERLLLVEVANGHNVGRVVEKLEKYAQAVDSLAINTAFDYGERAPRVLWLFEHQRTLELVQKRAQDSSWISSYVPYFFLRTLDNCTPQALQTGWLRPTTDVAAVSLF